MEEAGAGQDSEIIPTGIIDVSMVNVYPPTTTRFPFLFDEHQSPDPWEVRDPWSRSVLHGCRNPACLARVSDSNDDGNIGEDVGDSLPDHLHPTPISPTLCSYTTRCPICEEAGVFAGEPVDMDEQDWDNLKVTTK